VTDTINGVLDSTDAWAVPMNRGTSYRINIASPAKCLRLELYRPGVYAFRADKAVETWSCGGYQLFTPGIDGGGLYSLVVRDPDGDARAHYYRLAVAAAGADDMAPGVKLTNGEFVRGSIFGRGIDLLDLYRFDVPRENELATIDLRQKATVGLDLLLLNETGGRIACACSGKGTAGAAAAHRARSLLRGRSLAAEVRRFVRLAALRSRRHDEQHRGGRDHVCRDPAGSSGAADGARHLREPRRARSGRDRQIRSAQRLALLVGHRRTGLGRRSVLDRLAAADGRALACAGPLRRDAVQ
jgi:hypothetical protein